MQNLPVNNLRYFFSVGIVNPATKEVILRALQQKGLSLDEFPGCIFEPDDAEFSAILGKVGLASQDECSSPRTNQRIY